MIQLVVTIEADSKIAKGVNITTAATSKEPISAGEEVIANILARLITTAINISPATVVQAGSEQAFEEKKKVFGDILKSGDRGE